MHLGDPHRNPRLTPGEALQLGILILVLCVLLQMALVSTVMRAGASAGTWAALWLPWVIPSLIPPIARWISWRESGLLMPRGDRIVSLSILGGLVMLPLAAASLLLALRLSGLDLDVSLAWPRNLGPLVFAMPSSVGEEILFRGALQGMANHALPRSFLLGSVRLRHGTVLVAVFFGLIHLVMGGGAPDVIPLATWRLVQTGLGIAAGLLLGYIRDETQSVWIPGLLHFAGNAFLHFFSF